MVEGYRLDRVLAVWACATDFDASRRTPEEADAPRHPLPADFASRRSSRPRAAGPAAHEREVTARDDERVRVRVWHEPDVSIGDDPSPHPLRRPVGPIRSRGMPRIARMLHQGFGRAARVDRAREGPVVRTEPPEAMRRKELDLASNWSIRSSVIPRPSSLSMTEPGIRPPYGSCEAAIFPALGELLSVGLSREQGESMNSRTVLAVLVPLLNGVIELLDAGYQPHPFVLGALAQGASGYVVVDADLVTARRARSPAAAGGGDRVQAESGVAPGTSSRAQREARAAHAAAGTARPELPAREALTTLAPIVEELSVLLRHSTERGSAGDTLSARWALWSDHIEGASPRAALTLLEAQLFAWHEETAGVRASGGGHPDRGYREREPSGNDEAAPTEVDAA